jgi:hypothetical protein
VLLAAAGVPHDQIAAAIGTTRITLVKHFQAELDAGANMPAELEMRLLRQAQGRRGPMALKAIIYLLRSKYGWSENGAANLRTSALPPYGS